MAKNFHRSAFDDSTLLKLEIYRRYIREWLPVFIKRTSDRDWDGQINIYDFFCGPGKDRDGNEGSPIAAIRECLIYSQQAQQAGRRVSLYFSDSSRSKVKELQGLVEALNKPDCLKVTVERKSFSEAIEQKLPEMRRSANLIFIDQCGIKEVNGELFATLVQMKRTDFLFFIASSFCRRFRESPEFKKHLDLLGQPRQSARYGDSHRTIASMYRAMIPQDIEYFLAPFSLKKGSNIYGLIFGSGNLLGIYKFLRICWELDPQRGEANFDIDDDNLPRENENLDLFRDNVNSSKLVDFQGDLRERILSSEFNTDKEIFAFALENGFLPARHAKPVVTELCKSGAIYCNYQPRFSKACINEPRSITLR